MLTLCYDIILKISENISDCEKIYLSMASKWMHIIKYKFQFIELVHVNKINLLPYFDNFENVEISSTTTKIPKNVIYVHLLTNKRKIPPFVTHLTFDDGFD